MKIIKCQRCGVALDLSVSRCIGCGARKLSSAAKDRIVVFFLATYSASVIYWLMSK